MKARLKDMSAEMNNTIKCTIYIKAIKSNKEQKNVSFSKEVESLNGYLNTSKKQIKNKLPEQPK
jgi:hypothetical protein